MPRSRASAKQAGARAERAVADALAAALDDDRIDRRVKTGAKDRGDISGLRFHGHRIVIEVKDCARLDIPAWIREAHIEAGNDDALCGFVVYKKRGSTNPLDWHVAGQLRDLIALFTEERQEGCYE